MPFSAEFEKWLDHSLTDLKHTGSASQTKPSDENGGKNTILNCNFCLGSDEEINWIRASTNYIIQTKTQISERSRHSGEPVRRMTSRFSKKPDYWQLSYNEDDVYSRNSMEEMDKRFTPGDGINQNEYDRDTRPSSSAASADRVYYDNDDEDDEEFYDLPSHILDDGSQQDRTYDLDFQYSGSLEFSESDRRSFTSEPRSFAVDPEKFRIDFSMDNEFVAIDRIASVDESSYQIDFESSESGMTSPKNNPKSPAKSSVMDAIFRPPKPTLNKTNEVFSIRYAKATEEPDDNYIDDEMEAVELSPEDLLDTDSYTGEGILPMNSVELAMESDTESVLDTGLNTVSNVPGGPRSSQGARGGVPHGWKDEDVTPIIFHEHEPKRSNECRAWTSRNKNVIGLSVASICGLAALIVLIVYIVMTFT